MREDDWVEKHGADTAIRKVWTGKAGKPWQVKYGDGVDLTKMTFGERMAWRWYRSRPYKLYWHIADYFRWCCGCKRVVWLDFSEPEPELDEEDPRKANMYAFLDPKDEVITCCDHVHWYRTSFYERRMSALQDDIDWTSYWDVCLYQPWAVTYQFVHVKFLIAMLYLRYEYRALFNRNTWLEAQDRYVRIKARKNTCCYSHYHNTCYGASQIRFYVLALAITPFLGLWLPAQIMVWFFLKLIPFVIMVPVHLIFKLSFWFARSEDHYVDAAEGRELWIAAAEECVPRCQTGVRNCCLSRGCEGSRDFFHNAFAEHQDLNIRLNNHARPAAHKYEVRKTATRDTLLGAALR